MVVTPQPAPLGDAFADGELAGGEIPKVGARQKLISGAVLKMKIG